VQTVWQSADWHDGSFNSDYGILVLAQSVNTTPVALPPGNATGLWAPGVRVVEAGWGCQIPNAWPNYECEAAGGSPLMWTTFQATDGSPCSAYGFDAETGLCLQNERDTDTACNGDSGGPYTVLANNNRWYLVAAVSYGPTGCTLGKPVVGARTGHLTDSNGNLRGDLQWNHCDSGPACYFV
jgi:hypothetical protein